jgi:hypothetical protein
MAYCRNCGAKLDEDARFCRVCGTPVATVIAAVRPTVVKQRRPLYLLPVAILIAILVTAVIVSALIFFPFYPVRFNQTNQVPKADVDNLVVDFQADVAHVNVVFKNLPRNMVVLNVTADGSVGMFDDPDRAINVTFNHQTEDNSATVLANVSQAVRWPMFNTLNVNCNVYIDFSANLSLTIRSSVGDIVMNANRAVTLKNLNLETTTGSVEANLSKDVVITGALSFKTTTGSVHFQMDEADVNGNVSVDLRSTTGSVTMDVVETERLLGNVTLFARTTTGSVDLSMTIDNDVGARIESDTSIGGISASVENFSGNKSPLQSDNYPAGSNFFVNLRTTTGGIHIDAAYQSSPVRS